MWPQSWNDSVWGVGEGIIQGEIWLPHHMVMLVTYSDSFHSLSLQVGLDLWRKHTLSGLM